MEIAIGVVVVAALVAAGAVLLRTRGAGPSDEDRLHAAPRTRAADARVGQTVKVVGSARALASPLRTPLSERECLAYDVLVEHRVPPMRGRPESWAEAGSGAASVRFLVEDDSGAAIVDAEAITVISDDDAFHFVEDEERERLFRFLEPRADTRLVREEIFRYSEWTIVEGAKVEVLGRVTERRVDPAVAAGYREPAACAILRSADGPVVVRDATADPTDDPPDPS